MATTPRARAAQPAGDDFYAQGEEDFRGDEGTDDTGREDDEGTGGTEGATFGSRGQAGEDPGAAPGADEDLDADDWLDPTPPQQTRGQGRHQRQQNDNRRLQARIDELERAMRTQPPQGTPVYTGPREETDAEFAARIATLPYEDQADAKQQRWQRRQEAQNNFTRFQTLDAVDRTSYETKALRDGRYARWHDKVEAERQKLLQVGQFVEREKILAYLLGQHVLSNSGSKSLRREREQARDRVDRQTPARSRAGGGSDVASQGRRGQLTDREQRARRLENVQI